MELNVPPHVSVVGTQIESSIILRLRGSPTQTVSAGHPPDGDLPSHRAYFVELSVLDAAADVGTAADCVCFGLKPPAPFIGHHPVFDSVSFL
jgi:hypothetical protein